MIKWYSFILMFTQVVSCSSQTDELTETRLQLEESVRIMNSSLNYYRAKPVFNPGKGVSEPKKFSKTSKDSLLIETKIKNYLDSIQFSETILYPGNYLELDYDKYDFKEVLGNRHSGFDHEGYEPIFLVKSVKYKGSK